MLRNGVLKARTITSQNIIQCPRFNENWGGWDSDYDDYEYDGEDEDDDSSYSNYENAKSLLSQMKGAANSMIMRRLSDLIEEFDYEGGNSECVWTVSSPATNLTDRDIKYCEDEIYDYLYSKFRDELESFVGVFFDAEAGGIVIDIDYMSM